MPWTKTLCDHTDHCPGKVMVTLLREDSNIVIESQFDGVIRIFPCSVPGLMGAQRGSRTHLVSADGECVISKEADGVWFIVNSRSTPQERFFVSPSDYLAALSEMIEAKVIQKRISLQ